MGIHCDSEFLILYENNSNRIKNNHSTFNSTLIIKNNNEFPNNLSIEVPLF